MANPRTEWILAASWIAASLAVFLAVEASSARSWLYLAVVALVPSMALIGLWPKAPRETVNDVIHGRGRQS
jgi:hypothetical protein